MRQSTSTALGLWLALLGSGCQAVLGDFAVEKPNDAAVATNTSKCRAGTFRCNAEFLLRCNSAGTWELANACAAADQCRAIIGGCALCRDGELRCNGAYREACKADGTAWQRIAGAEGDCGSAELCNPGFCGTCPIPGALQCVAGGDAAQAPATTLERCEGGAWQVLDACASEQLCKHSSERTLMSPQSSLNACDPPSCVAGELTCEGTTLKRCPQSRDRWVTVDICASEAVCRAVVAGASDAEVAASLESCSPGCAPANAYFCNGQELQQCSADQVGFQALRTCAHGTTCDVASGECRGPCTAGAHRCNQAISEQCSADETWIAVQTCASAELCKAGRCVQPVCSTAGALRCDPSVPQQLQRCRDNLTGWDNVGSACAAGTACNADPALGPACLVLCPDSLVRCVGADRQTCNDHTGQPVWTTVATCATSGLCACALNNTCVAGARDDGCGAPLCNGSSPDYRCDGNTLQACANDRNGWVALQDCGADGGASLCFTQYATSNGVETSDVGRCLACPIALGRRCFDSALRECASDRSQWNTVTAACDYGCIGDATDSNRAYCAACSVGEARCTSASEVSFCDDNQRGMHTTNQSSCSPFACIDKGLADACGQCVEGERQCTDVQGKKGVVTCNNGAWGAAAVCGIACIDKGTADFCAPECSPATRRCQDDQSTTAYQLCTADGTWGTAIACDPMTPLCKSGGVCGCNLDADCPSTTPVCDSNVCVVCANDTLRCNTGNLDRCSGNTWGDDPSCNNSCDPAISPAVCGECVNDAERCNQAGDYERCVHGAWSLATHCTQTETCDVMQHGCIPMM